MSTGLFDNFNVCTIHYCSGYTRSYVCRGVESHLEGYDNLDDLVPNRNNPLLVVFGPASTHFIDLNKVSGFEVKRYGEK